jgi:hypothetical protein
VEARLRESAESVLRQYDKNKNGVLERDEIAQAPSWIRDADQNRDGTVTRDELIAKLAEYGRNRGEWSPDGRSGRAGSNSSANPASTRKSYRFLTAAERRPSGLPEWFLSKDKNEDGQVTMAEWIRFWSDEAATEFADRDLNGDGIITAAEALAFERKNK